MRLTDAHDNNLGVNNLLYFKNKCVLLSFMGVTWSGGLGPSFVNQRSRGLFLESPGNLTGLKSCFEIKVSRNVGCVLASNEVHFDSLADNFTVPFSKLLENKTA